MRYLTLAAILTVAFVSPAVAQAPLPLANRVVAVPTPLPSYSSEAAMPVDYYVTPGLTDSQYAFNLNTIGKIYSSIPPYAYGYNPYPQQIVYPGTPFYARPTRGWAAFRPYTGYNINFYPGYTVTPQGYYYPPYPF